MIGKPWLLSILSGIIAIIIYHFSISKIQDNNSNNNSSNGNKLWSKINKSNTKTYLGVFIIVALLVYGSFMISISTGECKLIEQNVEIQTGGRPPF